MLRLDRFLCECDASLTRKTAKDLLRDGSVAVNEIICKDPARKINPESDHVIVQGRELIYRKYRYFLLNKPAGVLSATQDKKSSTVLDLIPEAGQDYFPVGRLDRDTVGLLLITNDGPLAHELLSPKKHVPKTYIAVCRGLLTDADCEPLRRGMELDDFIAMPAEVRILRNSSEDTPETVLALTIAEGKYHQVKRMVAAIGSEVIALRRVRMGGLWLPADLTEGCYTELSEEELKYKLYEVNWENEDRLLRSYL